MHRRPNDFTDLNLFSDCERLTRAAECEFGNIPYFCDTKEAFQILFYVFFFFFRFGVCLYVLNLFFCSSWYAIIKTAALKRKTEK